MLDWWDDLTSFKEKFDLLLSEPTRSILVMCVKNVQTELRIDSSDKAHTWT